MQQKRGFFGVTRRSDFTQRLDIMFYSSICLPLIFLFFGLVRYQRPNSYVSAYVIFPDWLVWVLTLGCVIVALLGTFMYKKKIPNAKSQVLLRWKIQRFLRASSYRYSLPAFSGAFSSFGYYMTGEEEFAISVLFIFSLLLLQRPTTKKVCTTLSLKSEEISLFRSEQTWA